MLTPHQFYAAFTSPATGETPGRVEALRAANDERGRKGLPPVVPSWMLG